MQADLDHQGAPLIMQALLPMKKLRFKSIAYQLWSKMRINSCQDREANLIKMKPQLRKGLLIIMLLQICKSNLPAE